ncbi:MAG TPA: Sir2 family NAD-dependent protein deacetylase [Candidatus Thermoplasmatota archaeon]|nr:Sir2 family NAD-dependent protein deacetylase [Candidatus Thermoplasmatota archaeon]
MDLAPATRVLRDARRLVVLTGAGVSTESGVPDFRTPGSGVWERFDPQEFRYERFLHDPAGFWHLRAKLMEALDLAAARPNAAHEALARASQSPRFVGHVTQNIDGLFHDAGHMPEKLVEVHGTARKVRCVACQRFFPYEVAREAVDVGRLPPSCPACGGHLKPGTVLFGEQLPEHALDTAAVWMRHADAVLVVGSSLTVYPVAALPTVALDTGAALVLVNATPTAFDGMADAVVRAKAGAVLPQMLREAGF